MRFKSRLKPAARQKPRSGSGETQKNVVFSYYSDERRQDTRERYEQPRQSRSKLLKQIPTLIAGLAVLVCIARLISLDVSNPKIEYSHPGNSLLRERQAYDNSVKEVLGSDIFYRSKITIDTKKAEKALLDEFPELSSASITLPVAARRPIIHLKMNAAKVIVLSSYGQFLIDDNGKAIMQLDDSKDPGGLGLIAVRDESELKFGVGDSMLTQDETAFINSLALQLNNSGLKLSSLTLPKVPSELHARIEGKPYFVKLNLRGDARLSAGTLIAAVKKLEADKVTPAEYVDVRVEERAYYK